MRCKSAPGFTQQTASASRWMWIASALISMTVSDIFHSCVPVGVSFLWLHSMAVLTAGGGNVVGDGRDSLGPEIVRALVKIIGKKGGPK